METEQIRSGGAGGFLCPPGHPMHTTHVATDCRRRRENQGSMSLECATTCDYIGASVRAEARRLLDAWAAKRQPIEAYPVQLWIRGTLAYFKTCYKGEGPEPWNADALHICGGLQDAPRDEGKRALYLHLCESYGIKERAHWPRCFQEHPLGDHAGVRMIRRYYPEYEPRPEHFASPDCGDCGHHLNAHDNGKGGRCTAILDMALYEKGKAAGHGYLGGDRLAALCRCPGFSIAEVPA